MKLVAKLFVLVAALSLVTYACKNDDINTDAEANASAETEAITDDVTEDIVATTDDALESFGQFGPGAFRGCATITHTGTLVSFPDTILIDFGATGCAGPGGRMYYGAMQVIRTGAPFQAGSSWIVSSISLMVDSIGVAGTHTRTFNGLNGSGQPYWTVTASHTLTFPDGTTSSLTSSRVRTMIGGNTTPNIRVDDVYEITGSSQGVNRNGVSFTSTITTPLTVEVSCRWITSGVVAVTGPNGTRSLDYGAGSCDRLAIVTGPNGTSHNIVLRR